MSSLFDDTPEELDALRSSVEKWLEKAANSVWSFRREDEASFWRDTEQFEDHEAGRLDKSKPPSLTATARCYMALAYARRYAKDPDVGRRADDPNIPLDWKDSVRDFVAKTRLKVDRNFKIAEWEPKKKKKQTGRRTAKTANKKKPINNFEIAHLSDFRFVCDFQNRFPTGDHDEPNHIHMIRSRRDGEFGATVSRTIRGIIEAKASATGNEDNRSVARINPSQNLLPVS